MSLTEEPYQGELGKDLIPTILDRKITALTCSTRSIFTSGKTFIVGPKRGPAPLFLNLVQGNENSTPIFGFQNQDEAVEPMCREA